MIVGSGKFRYRVNADWAKKKASSCRSTPSMRLGPQGDRGAKPAPFYESAEPNIAAASYVGWPARQAPAKLSPFSMTGPTACRQGPMVRIHFPPADSPSLSRSHFRASRTRAFPAGVRGSLDDGVSRDAAGFPLRANRRQCLCRAIFQYRSAADVVGENAAPVPTKSGLRRD